MSGSKAGLGPWVRLEGISISQLPLGGKGMDPIDASASNDISTSSTAPSLTEFITNVLTESIPFIDGVAPKDGSVPTWTVKGSAKKYASSEAPVHLSERVVSGKDLDGIEGMSRFSADRKNETWFCRRSCHRNATEKGTASWQEFVRSFKDHHAETEDAFTPTVIGARQAMSWDTNGVEVNIHGGQWTNITVVLEEMKHKIDPKPLKNRTFPVIQVSAMLAGVDEFLVISIPVHDFDKSPHSEFARDKSLVVAAYASIERIRVLPSNGDIEWIMATASDARGVLPQWMQNLAVPGAVAKDVEMFMSWIPSQRGSAQMDTKPSDTPTAPISNTEAQPGSG